MKVLLINPLTPEKRMIHNTPNLGLGYIATALRKNGFSVEVCDGMKKGMTNKKLIDRLMRADYDVAGCQVYTCSLKESLEILKLIKSKNPGCITVAGGPHPSGDPEQVLTDLTEADFAFRGEAEEGLPKLLNKLAGHQECAFEEIPNLVRRDKDRILCNPLQPVENLDSLGMPSWDLIAPNEYPNAPIGAFARNFPLTTISCTRGCAHYCTFCANTRIMGRKLRARSSQSILAEMQLLYYDHGIREFQIIDDCFTSNRTIAMEVCRGIIESGMEISISFPNGVRIESLDEELLQSLEQAGCYSLGMAIETGSQRIMDHMRRGQTLEMIRDQVAMVRRACNIRMTGFFIIGYPEEKVEDVLETIRLSRSLPFSRANFTLWMPVPGSEMTEKLRKEGKLKDVDPDRIVINKISYVSENMTWDQMRKYFIKAYAGFYLRPAIIIGLLREIRSFEQFKYIMTRVFKLFFVKSE
ncbi:MAG: cobalamin B12-binding domain-containing protein [Nitrospirae bacterium]|nr:cobalamin B12-binding domain-containing protein [Nitrospirota bacterium]